MMRMQSNENEYILHITTEQASCVYHLLSLFFIWRLKIYSHLQIAH